MCMKRIIPTLLFLMTMSVNPLFAQNYELLWKKINKYEIEGRPQSVIATAQEILRKAQSERMATQMMRAYLTAMAHRTHLSVDSFYVDIAGLEAWVADPVTPVSDAAMLHSLLGSIYTYSAQGRYDNKVVNPLPEDMSQWTQLMYHQRAFDHFMASVSRLEELRGYSTLAYTPLTYQGRWSDYYQHDLMHLIGRRAATGISQLENRLSRAYKQTEWKTFALDHEQFSHDTLPFVSAYDCPTATMRIYQRMLALIDPDKQAGAWIFMEQNRLNTIPQHRRDDDEHLRLLRQMKERFNPHELCGSICYDMATILRKQGKNAEALATLREGITDYPKYGAINLLRNMEKEILLPQLTTRSINIHYYPGDTAHLNISHRNLNGFTVWLHRVNCPLDTLQQHANNPQALKKYSKFYNEQKYILVHDKEYLSQDTIVPLSLPKEAGCYLIETLANGKGSDLKSFYVSPYQIVAHSLPGDIIEYAVLDGMSGHPVADATLHTARYDRKMQKIIPIESKPTGKQGCITVVNGTDGNLVRVSTPTENTMPYMPKGYYSKWQSRNERRQLVTRLLSDRTHFRPGQTIYIKGISYWQLPEDCVRADKGDVFELTLKGPKGQVIEKKEVKSNEFGTFSTEFVLPADGLNGRYLIETPGGTIRTGDGLYFYVEEYKLPTFEVTFDTVKTAYAIGDTVTLTGRAMTYSGVPVANGKVNYNVRINSSGWLRGWRKSLSDFDTTDGKAVTDTDGRFSVKVVLDDPFEGEDLCWWHHEYVIMSTVTSPSGESQEAHTALELSSCPLKLDILRTDYHMIKEKPHPLLFHVTNLSGAKVDAEVDYRIYLTNENLETGKLVHEGRHAANQPLPLEFLDQHPSAHYKIVATTAPAGKKDSVQNTNIFIIYAENETKVPLGLTDWFHWQKDEVAIGEPACLQFGTREKDAYILMDVFSEMKRIESRRFYLSDTVQTFTFDYLPKYGKGMYASIMYIKNGNIRCYTQTLNKKRPDKRLELKWETFRNRLTPGTEEEWTLSVNHPDGTSADAELLASMHDASLNQLGRQRPWNFSLHFPRLGYRDLYWNYHGGNMFFTRTNFDLMTKQVPTQWHYDGIVERYYTFSNVLFRKGVMSQQNGAELASDASFDSALAGRVAGGNIEEATFVGSATNGGLVLREREISFGTQTAKEAEDEMTVPEPMPNGMQLRENFTETAFFQPHLRTDSMGQVKVSFTLPDNLTRWHFRALAHTKQMDYGTLEDFATAQREFMVQPNLPRFVRMGDETSVSASLNNLSEKDIKGTARLELIDPMTERVILARKAKFNVQAGKSSAVSFTFTVKNTDVPLPICRIVADGGKFSDGEQHYLPVLTNKVWITESQPLMVNGPGKVEEEIDHLFNHHSPTANNHRLTVELTGNPAWLAIQALPTVATPTEEDAFSWATAWYAHSVASHIAQSQPKIKAVFDSWLSEGCNEEALWSNLQKNQELKTLLMDETPWMTDATDEAAQKRQIALLFDKANTRQRIEGYLQKLAALQKEEGGWSWYKGMQSSRYVTTYILELMERTNYLAGDEQGVESHRIMERAATFLNQELTEEYTRLLKEEKDGQEVCPSDLALTYLCSQALNSKLLDKEIKTMAEYMVRLLPGQMHRLTPYGKAKASILLKQYGLTEEANRFLTSLKEYTTYTPLLGRFFDNPSSIFGWRNQRIPTQVATIEALTFAGSDSLTVEQMKQWLLIQKQAQSWDNPLNTVDAVYALLISGTDLLSTEQSTTLKLDGKAVTSAILPTPGLDYLKRSYTTDELKRLPRKAGIEKSSQGLAWGAVYAQYLEEMDRTTSTYTGRTATAYGQALDQPLSIERVWMVKRTTSDKSQTTNNHTAQDSSQGWIPLTEGMELHVGDQILSQLIIRCDRAMDFVQIKDSRAACTEPVSSASGYRYNDGIGYYCSMKDAATLYFIDHLPKGTYTLEQAFRIDRAGHYQTGIATIQCAYAPEFTGHTGGAELDIQ